MTHPSPPRFSNIGVDTGGTFIDLVMIDEDGVIRTNKVSPRRTRLKGVFDVLSRAATALNTSVPETCPKPVCSLMAPRCRPMR